MGVISSYTAVYAQGEIDHQQRVFFRNEWSVGLMINSNGFGGNYRYGQRINAADKRLYEIDFAYLRDPKEFRSYVVERNSNARYVEGKTNFAVNFRIGYGKQHERFRKHDRGGIAIRRFHNFGPSIAVLKPIYYNVGTSTMGRLPLDPLPDNPHRYSPMWNSSNIWVINRASFFKGFSEIGIVPGAFGKFGYNFEFGSHDRIIHALEAGLIAEGFLQRLQIMDFGNPDINHSRIAQNQQFFLTVFLSYRFGRIVDPYEVRKKRERSREISY